jgi:outer membrane receptor for monomeric catechols
VGASEHNPDLEAYSNGAPPVDQSNFYGLTTRDYEKTDTDLVTAEVEHDLSKGTSLRNLTRWGQNVRDSVITQSGRQALHRSHRRWPLHTGARAAGDGHRDGEEIVVMRIQIPEVRTAEQVAHARRLLDGAEWVDGKVTAGHQSARAKNNMQLPEGTRWAASSAISSSGPCSDSHCS